MSCADQQPLNGAAPTAMAKAWLEFIRDKACCADAEARRIESALASGKLCRAADTRGIVEDCLNTVHYLQSRLELERLSRADLLHQAQLADDNDASHCVQLHAAFAESLETSGLLTDQLVQVLHDLQELFGVV